MAKHLFEQFLLGIFAGILIAAGGAVNLQLCSMGQNVLGGVFFPVGLLGVCFLGASLFTGKVGYVAENKPVFLLDLLIMLIGNCLGAAVIGYLCGAIIPGWTVPLTDKFAYGEGSSFLNCFLRAMAAGGFVYLAVECFKKVPSHAAKAILIIAPIACMVILGCNHSIANVFYFAYAQIRVPGFDALNAVVSILVAVIGNALGSIVLYFLQNGGRMLLAKAKSN